MFSLFLQPFKDFQYNSLNLNYQIVIFHLGISLSGPSYQPSMLDVRDIDEGPNRGGGWRCFYKIKDREMCIGNLISIAPHFMCKVKH